MLFHITCMSISYNRYSCLFLGRKPWPADHFKFVEAWKRRNPVFYSWLLFNVLQTLPDLCKLDLCNLRLTQFKKKVKKKIWKNDILKAQRIYSCWNNSAVKRRWRKNIAGRLHRRRGNAPDLLNVTNAKIKECLHLTYSYLQRPKSVHCARWR